MCSPEHDHLRDVQTIINWPLKTSSMAFSWGAEALTIIVPALAVERTIAKHQP